MAHSTRILALVAMAALGLFAVKALSIGTNIFTLLDPATPAWASSAKAKKKVEKKPDPVVEPVAEEPRHEAEMDAPLCQGPSLAEQAGLSEQELNVYLTLGERNQALDERESEIAVREGLLGVTRQQIDERIAKLETLQAGIATLLDQLGEQEEAQVLVLTKLYDTMKPKSAAQIFGGLDKEVLLRLASRMKADSLSKVMAAMPVQKASALTIALAERHRLPETTKDLPGFSKTPK